jgi:hypothetical protein
MNKVEQKALVSKITSKRVLKRNADSFKAYDGYKRAVELVERAEVAVGRRVVFKSDTGSTLNFEINPHGAWSTTAQTI